MCKDERGQELAGKFAQLREQRGFMQKRKSQRKRIESGGETSSDEGEINEEDQKQKVVRRNLNSQYDEAADNHVSEVDSEQELKEEQETDYESDQSYAESFINDSDVEDETAPKGGNVQEEMKNLISNLNRSSAHFR
jgi:hypothetical protein